MRKQRFYVIISSEVEFSSLREAEKNLEEHIAAKRKVGDYEIFRDEAAHSVQLRENDTSIALYVSSGDDDDYVIIRPKKKRQTNNQSGKN